MSTSVKLTLPRGSYDDQHFRVWKSRRRQKEGTSPGLRVDRDGGGSSLVDSSRKRDSETRGFSSGFDYGGA